jgi:hypothetical protein
MVLALLGSCRRVASLHWIVPPTVDRCMGAASHPHAYFAEIPVKRWRTPVGQPPFSALVNEIESPMNNR